MFINTDLSLYNLYQNSSLNYILIYVSEFNSNYTQVVYKKVYKGVYSIESIYRLYINI